MKLKIGDSIKLKDGRKFKVVSKDNGYFVLKDSKGRMAKVKDSRYLVYEWKEGFGRDNTNSPKTIAKTYFGSIEEADEYAKAKAKELYNSVKANNPYDNITFGFEITCPEESGRLIREYRVDIEGDNIEFYKNERVNEEGFTEEELNFHKHIIRTDLTDSQDAPTKEEIRKSLKIITQKFIKTNYEFSDLINKLINENDIYDDPKIEEACEEAGECFTKLKGALDRCYFLIGEKSKD